MFDAKKDFFDTAHMLGSDLEKIPLLDTGWLLEGTNSLLTLEWFLD